MTPAERELLERLLAGERLDWVHPLHYIGVALDGGVSRPAISQRTVHACIRLGWVEAQICREYFQPVMLTEKGRLALIKEEIHGYQEE
jgi:hypothetical protein